MPRFSLKLAGLLLCPFLIAGCPGSGGAGCKQDSDCPAGRYCDQGACTYDCTFDSECPEDRICNPRGRCEAGCQETNGGDEICDGLDNDCDGQTDELWPNLGQACQNGGCLEGILICGGDGLTTVCDGPQPALDDSTCDGVDDDCDGQTDEDAAGQACPLQAGVCAGAESSCQPGGTYSECDYGPDHVADLDDSCDQKDNDCDGQTDEDAAFDYSGEFGPAAADGIDNNCNGLVDEPGGAMVRIDDAVAIDAFEVSVFETAACDGQRYGLGVDDYPASMPADGPASDSPYACSIQGVIPSGHLSWYRAASACQAQGKRLCTASEYRRACAGSGLNAYPYGPVFIPGACNDAWNGPSQPAETGSYADCRSGFGAFDMSANFAEWVSDTSTRDPAAAAMAVAWYECELCHFGQDCWQCGDTQEDENYLHYAADCMPEADTMLETGMRDLARAHFGARCCWDIP